MKKHRIISSIAVLTLSVFMAFTVSGAAADLPPAGNPSYRVLDISEYNGTAINWATVAPNFDIVYLRASIKQGADGVVRKDKYVTTNSNNARNAGLHVGYYHYFRPSLDASKNIEQADFYFNTLKTLSYDCVPVIDVEELSETKNSANLTREQISNAVLQFNNRFEQLSGIKPMIYASASRVDEFLDSRLSSCKFWVAAWYGKVPTKGNTVFSRWDMWQQAGDVYTAGVVGTVDTGIATSNVLLGSRSGVHNIETPKGTYGLEDINVKGWALSYYDIERVDIYVDGKGFDSVMKKDFTDRTDVENAYAGKGYSDPLNSGYSITIPNGYLGQGQHRIDVALITSKGAVWSGSQYFNVNIPNDKIAVESPSGTYSGDIGISGWAATAYDVKRVDIYIDGKGWDSVMGDDFYARPDVEKAYAGWGFENFDKCGYSYTIKKGALSVGNHTVSIALINSKGGVTWSSAKSFSVNYPADRVLLDTPNGTYSGDVTVSGWATTCRDVKRVDIYVDGKGWDSVMASDFYGRSDIAKVFAGSGYSNFDKSGFSYKIKKGALSSGSHTVSVAFINGQGGVTWSSSKSFNVNIPSNRLCVDTPYGTYKDDVTISGWALTANSNYRIDVYIDGKGYDSIMGKDFFARSDVAKAFAGYGYSNYNSCGYKMTVPIERLSRGSHYVRLAFIDGAGNVTWSNSKYFKVDYPDSRICLDTPNGTYSGDVGVSGWGLSAYGINNVEIYVNGELKKTVENDSLFSRPDVKNVFAAYGYTGFDKCGFSTTISHDEFMAGSNTVKVVVKDNKGNIAGTDTKTITVK